MWDLYMHSPVTHRYDDEMQPGESEDCVPATGLSYNTKLV